MVRYLFYTIGDLTYQSPLVKVTNFRFIQFCDQEARAAFRQLLCESTVRIDSLAKKLGACVERARPYYEARMKAKEVIKNNNVK